MKIARLLGDAGPGFAFQRRGMSGWVTAGSIGLDIPDIQSLIHAYDQIAELVETAEADIAELSDALCPVFRPRKVMGVGLNYLAHIEEVGKPKPTEPLVFAKYSSAVIGPNDDIELASDVTAEVDYECELAVIIGKPTRRATPENALESVFGYCVANDVSARDIQRNQSQISRSKSLDTFCPMGPWITTADEIPDPHSLGIRTFVNEGPRQDSNTADMLFDVAYLVVHLSSAMTLEAGDVILTGTPAGVGSGMKPPTYLQAGDVVRCEIDALGFIENRVIAGPISELLRT